MQYEIVGARVDERLIHGQVATAWTNSLRATRIMVIDDDVVTSPTDKMILKMACPANCKLSILRVTSAIANLKAGKYEGDRIFIVSKRPRNFLSLLEDGVVLPRLVLGNMSGREDGAAMLRRSVYVTRSEAEEIEKIRSFGVEVVLQQTPADGGELFDDVIRAKGGQLWD